MDAKTVIKAWEIFRDSNPYEICNGREFRAITEPEYCMSQMIEDTIALLKEQEAHLLDISEIYTAHKLDVWIEEKCDNTVHPLMLVETEMTDKRQAAFFVPMTVRPVKAYGKTWRCWSARPKYEQRKAVKWDGIL